MHGRSKAATVNTLAAFSLQWGSGQGMSQPLPAGWFEEMARGCMAAWPGSLWESPDAGHQMHELQVHGGRVRAE